MMTFEIRLYPHATENDDAPMTLGEPGEVVTTIKAEYPAAALTAAEPTIVVTRSETTSRMQRGKRVAMTVYRPADGANAAWLMALVFVDRQPAAALHACTSCGRHPSTHAPGGDTCGACGLGDERDPDGA